VLIPWTEVAPWDIWKPSGRTINVEDDIGLEPSSRIIQAISTTLGQAFVSAKDALYEVGSPLVSVSKISAFISILEFRILHVSSALEYPGIY
jgi:hypothetical protein